MIRQVGLVAAVLLLGTGVVFAQETNGAGRTEIDAALFGGGAIFMPAATSTESTSTNYVLSVAATRNLNPWIGVEGDLAVALVRHDAHALYGTVMTNQKAPNMLLYGGNLVYNPTRSDRPIVPYLEGGVGSLRVFDGADAVQVGFLTNSSHWTANAGGGLRWFVLPHYGIRADYRYLVIQNYDNNPALVGQQAIHHAHRVYGALIVTF